MFDRINRWVNGKSLRPLPLSSTGSMVGILIAAGRSSRFDPSGEKNKLMVNLDGVPLVCHSGSHLAEAVEKRIAVVRPGSSEIPKWLAELGYTVIECPDAHSGMGHSIAWGVAEALKRFECERIVIALGDMPFIRPSTIAGLVNHSKTTSSVVAPRFAGKRGNPVVFGPDHFEALSRLSGDRGASHYMNSVDVQIVDVDDPGVLKDIDTPDDLIKR